jgi:multisubunit Na+/H+ antiporter MnhB subunit
MLKGAVGGCVVGVGLGIIFITVLFERALSEFGSPLTVDVATWDWRLQVNTWRVIGAVWVVVGIVVLLVLYAVGEKRNSGLKPSPDAEQTTAVDIS